MAKSKINMIIKICLQRVIAISVLLCMFVSFPVQAITNEVPFDSYTYWEDYPSVDKREVYSRPMYQPKLSINAQTLGLDNFIELSDVCTDHEGYTYLLDGGASVLYILDANYKLAHILKGIYNNGERLDFTKARGVYVDSAGYVYIADTENARVLKADKTGTLIKLYTLPDSNLIPENFQYRPVKLTVDSKGNTYILSDGSYYGAILYAHSGEFKGFFGSNNVGGSVLDVLTTLYNRLFMNNAKRAASKSRLPYQFTDLYVDADDFIYTSTGRTEKNNIQTGQLRCFSPGGLSVDKTESINFGDVSIGKVKESITNQDLFGLALDDDGFIYLIDSVYGRVFVYDHEYRLMSAFGGGMGIGQQQGSFVMPCAIEVNKDEVLVCDSSKNSLTIFSITEYGKLVKNARLLTLKGEYEKSRTLWEQILKQDRNNQLAYIGLGKAAYSSGDYKLAMEYAKDGYDRETYAQAYKIVRKEILAKNFPVIFIGIVMMVCFIFILKAFMKRQKKRLIKNIYVKNMLSSIVHPFDSFAAVKEKKLVSLPLCIFLIAIFYILTVLQSIWGAFLYVDYNAAQFNSLFVILQTVGIVVLWTVSNWAVCTLSGGIGKLSEIFAVTTYSLIPVMAGQIVNLVLSHILLPEESRFLSVITIALTIYAGFMLTVGMMKIHDFGFTKFIGTSLLTVVGMLIGLFLLFIIIILVQQLGAFLITILKEFIYIKE